MSNLNRQFLFRPHHVTMSKAEVCSQHVWVPNGVCGLWSAAVPRVGWLQVAKIAVHGFNPDASVTAHHANVKGSEYNIEFYKGFDVVMNALDNVSARRYVGVGPCMGCGFLSPTTVTACGGCGCVHVRGVQPRESPLLGRKCTVGGERYRGLHRTDVRDQEGRDAVL